MRTALQITGGLTVLTAVVIAQARPEETFDVASVKTVRTGDGIPWILVMPGGRVTAEFATASELIQAAYHVQRTQVSGGPAWIDTTHFAIEARARSVPTLAAARTMLRSLLRDRFGLAVHTEQRMTRGFVLSRVDPAAVGPGLRSSGARCQEPTVPKGVPAPPEAAPASSGEPMHLEGDRLRCPTWLFSGHWSLRAASAQFLADLLADEIKRPIVDHSGLTGEHDFDLTFAPGLEAHDPDAGPVGTPGSAPALRTALVDQLGLRLTAATVPVTMTIVDRINRPAEN